MGNKQSSHSKYYQNDNQVAMDDVLDTLSMLFYSIGLFCNGHIRDRLDYNFLTCTGV